MTDSPFPTNKPADQANSAISAAMSAAEEMAEKLIQAELETQFPVLALPVIKEVERELVVLGTEYVGGKLSVGLQQVGTFLIIDTEVSHEKTGVSKALADLMLAEKSGDQNAIAQAIAAYQKAQSALVNSDGAAPAQ